MSSSTRNADGPVRCDAGKDESALLRAAPLMLEALRDAERALQTWVSEYKPSLVDYPTLGLVRRAIAEAEGR
jgi:hypothetical protein